MPTANKEQNTQEFLYLIKTIEDDKLQLVTKTDTAEGVILSEGKLCAVLKRYTLPVDTACVSADIQRFSGAAPAAQPSLPEPEAPAPVKTTPVSAVDQADPISVTKQNSDGMIRHLSDMKKRPASPYCKMSPKYHGKDHRNKLATLGDAFWGKSDRVLLDLPGNTGEIRFEAISRLEKYLESLRCTVGSDRSLAGRGECSSDGNCITYEYHYISGGPCYDTHSDDPDIYETIVLTRITREVYEQTKKIAKDVPIGDSPSWTYEEDLPFEDQSELFILHGTLFLKDPMGISGYYKMDTEMRSELK